MKKIVTGTIGLAILSFCLGAQNIPGTKAYVAQFNAAAKNVVGQADMSSNNVNRAGSPAANTLDEPCSVFVYGTKLFVADTYNNRVLIYNTIPTSDGASADVVIGQLDMASNGINQGGSVAANTLYYPTDAYTDGTKLFVADYYNNRVLIYNSIPTANNASADVVIGQADMTHRSANQGDDPSASTLSSPYSVRSNGAKLFITDSWNHRVLIYNSIPSSNNASANVVVGQANTSSSDANQGGNASENTLNRPTGVYADDDYLIISDQDNNRVLIYNGIPNSNNQSSNVVVGQPNMTSGSANQGGSAGAAGTLNDERGVYVYNGKLYVSDFGNNRVTIYNSIPTSNNTSADGVIGQENFTSTTLNKGGAANATTLNSPHGVYADAQNLIIADRGNHRVLIYNNQDVSASPSALNYSKAKGKSKSVNLYFYGLTVDSLKKKYYTARIDGKGMKVKSVKRETDRVKVKVQFKYGKKARGVYDVSLKFKHGSTITRSGEDIITIQ